jgi:hypothetical protein
VTIREKASPGYDPDSQRAWREELGIPIRVPRSGYERVQEMLIKIRSSRVFLREHSKTTDVVVRFDCSSAQLPPVLQQMYFGDGVKLPFVFDQVLSKPRTKGRSAFDSELFTLGYNVYCQTWIRLFEILYQDTLHPAVNPPSWLTEFRDRLKRNVGGRRKRDTGTFNTRFTFFLKLCKGLRASIELVMLRARAKNENTEVTGRQVRETLWREIIKIPKGESILGGEAFLEIPYATTKKSPVIENLASWTPRQLAIALMAFESGLKYQTVEKRLARHRPPKPTRSR